MKRKDKSSRPGFRPVQRIELPEINVKMRWIAIVILLAIAATAIGRGVYELVNIQPGWHTVEVASKEPNCSREFVFQYDFRDAGGAASAQLRQLNEVYKTATEDAFRLFSPEAEESGNVRFLNEHVNETVTVDPALYRALSVFSAETSRYLFLAPAYAEYDHVFLSQEDTEASWYDPNKNEDTAQWLAELVQFTNDPSHISLELTGEHQVRLNVSDAYLAFARENGIETFLDFGWMKNAFIVDFLADVLTQNGFTRGYLASFDGFTRNLDPRGMRYGVNLFCRQGADIYTPANFHYTSPMNLVFLRDFPLGEEDRWHYYAYENGEILTAFLDPADAGSKAAVPSLMAYGLDKSCGEILVELLPVFVADSFDPQRLGQGTEAIWFENTTICHTEADADLELLSAPGGVTYTIQ